MPDISEHLGVAEYAAAVGMPKYTVYGRVRAGTLPSIRIGGAILIHRDATWRRKNARKRVERKKAEPRPSEKQKHAERLLREWIAAGVVARGFLTEIAREVGLTRERVRQIAVEMGISVANTGPLLASRVYLACATCGERPVWGWRTGGVQCVKCKKVPVMCDYCGVVVYRDEAQFLHNAERGAGLGGDKVIQCNRAGRRRCPRSPAMFVLQLGCEWQKLWIDTKKYRMAAYRFGHVHGIKVQYETREDGIWMRKVK